MKFIILAAGNGSRLNSSIPKPLHCIAGKPLLLHVLENCSELASSFYVVYKSDNKNSNVLLSALSKIPETHSLNIKWVPQDLALGTGYASLLAIKNITAEEKNLSDIVVITYADVPFISSATFKKLIEHFELKNREGITVLSALVEDPRGYGRIIRDAQLNFCGIVEEFDCKKEEKLIKEINAGVIISTVRTLRDHLENLDINCINNEIMLTDIFKKARKTSISTYMTNNPKEIIGINTMEDLIKAEKIYQKLLVSNLQRNGLRISENTYIKGNIGHGSDVVIEDNVTLEGTIHLKDKVHVSKGSYLKNVIVNEQSFIEPNVFMEGNNYIGKCVIVGMGSYLKNVKIEDYSIIKPYTVLEDCVISSKCQIGPFARIRPGSIIKENVKIGNFAEIKDSCIGESTKVSHFCYIGNSNIGKYVNVGAGFITCNFDGKKKSDTIVKDKVFIGSGVKTIAPVTLEEGSIIGAGTVVTKDVCKEQLAIGRAKQKNFKKSLLKEK